MSRELESHMKKVLVTYACGHTRTLRVMPPTWYIEDVCQSIACEKCGRYEQPKMGKSI